MYQYQSRIYKKIWSNYKSFSSWFYKLYTIINNATLASGTYYVRVENNDGNAARSTNAILTASSAPSWTTAAGSLGTVGAAELLQQLQHLQIVHVTITETTSVLTSNSDTPNSTMNLTLH